MSEKPSYEELEQKVVALEQEFEKRRKAEKELRQAEDKYRSLTNNVNVGLYRNTVGVTGKFLEANPTIVDMFGYRTKEEFLGVNVSDLYKNSDDRKNYNAKMLKNGAVKNEELQLVKKDGTAFVGSISAVVVKDENGEVKYYDGIIEDITEQKRVLMELRKSEERFRSVYETAPLAFVVWDKNTRVVDWNKKAEDIFKWSKWEVIGKSFFDFLIPEAGRPKVEDIVSSLLNGTLLSHSTDENLTKDGEIIICDWNNSALHDGEGNVIGAISLGLDITERKRAEAEREKLQATLNQAQKMEAIGILAGGIAHDFNNILSSIFGYSQLAEIHIDTPEKARQHIGQVIKGAQRATALIKQILTLSRKSEYKKQPLSVFTVLKETLKLLRSSIPTTIEIKANIFSRASIMADPTQVHQVIMNLCTNAYQAMNETGGILTLGLDEVDISKDSLPDLNMLPGRYLKLEVSDTGHGIDKKTLERIFDPYFTTKEIGKGTGLGLAVVDAVIKEHNGYIIPRSEVGQGSTFEVFWPIIEKASFPSIEEKEKIELPAGTERIMIVDDEKDILDVLQAILGRQGYQIAAFSDGASALETFARNPDQFDLIITDMTMPHMTGDALSAEILKIRKDIPIIFCTGYHETFTEDIARDIGISRYVLKPVSGQELSVLIREILDEKKTRPDA